MKGEQRRGVNWPGIQSGKATEFRRVQEEPSTRSIGWDDQAARAAGLHERPSLLPGRMVDGQWRGAEVGRSGRVRQIARLLGIRNRTDLTCRLRAQAATGEAEEPRGIWLRCQRRPWLDAASLRRAGPPKWLPVHFRRANISDNVAPHFDGSEPRRSKIDGRSVGTSNRADGRVEL